MIVYQFNTYLTGGAAIAARRLHDSLIAYGAESVFNCLNADLVSGDSYRGFEQGHKSRTKVGKLTKRIGMKYYRWKLSKFTAYRPACYELFSYSKLPFSTPFELEGHNVDVINLHWITGLIDYPSFFASIPDEFPIVWTMHDMNPFTGGCHYAWDCENFKVECKICPQLNNNSFIDLARKSFYTKYNAIKKKNIHVVANSYWLEHKARRSRLLSNAKSFQTIHFGVDVNLYVPKCKSVCKQVLSIPRDCVVICFGAHSIANRRKGFKELLEALTLLPDKNRLYCVVFGRGGFTGNVGGLPSIKLLGHIASPALQSLVYSAADLFVIPSLYEAFGQTALEAMACGTPVVGFDTGGIPDIVRPMHTGLLAKAGDYRDLAENIRWMIEHPDRRVEMGENARQMVEREFTLNILAKKYMSLYQSLIKAKLL